MEEILHATVADIRRFDLLAPLEIFRNHRTRAQILQLALHVRLRLTLATELGRRDEVRHAVDLNGSAGLEFSDLVHDCG
jgi:hypothetical protein